MLQQNFQTPEALGLTAPQHRALVLTLNALERGELRYVPVHGPSLWPFSEDYPYTGHFNMRTFQSALPCGTVCCIAGTAELLGNTTFAGLNRSPELEELFFPSSSDPEYYDKITPDQAAIALRAYLTTGVPDWSHVA